MLRTYSLGDSGPERTNQDTPAAQTDFDKLQTANGSSLEVNGITENSIPALAEKATILMKILGTIQANLFTFGGDFIAGQLTTPEQLDSHKAFLQFQKGKVCVQP